MKSLLLLLYNVIWKRERYGLDKEPIESDSIY